MLMKLKTITGAYVVVSTETIVEIHEIEDNKSQITFVDGSIMKIDSTLDEIYMRQNKFMRKWFNK